MQVLLSIFFITMILSTLVYFYFFNMLKDVLDKRFPEDYKNMGKPSLLSNSTVENNRKFKQYLYGKQYLKHNDKELNSLCSLVLFLLKVGNALTAITFLLFILHVFEVLK